MTNAEIMAAVWAWQANPRVHPLTCGQESDHGSLSPLEIDGRVVLTCAECGYRQDFIPPVVVGYRPLRKS